MLQHRGRFFWMVVVGGVAFVGVACITVMALPVGVAISGAALVITAASTALFAKSAREAVRMAPLHVATVATFVASVVRGLLANARRRVEKQRSHLESRAPLSSSPPPGLRFGAMGFDEKAYWRKRHVDMTGKLTAVGIDHLRERTNEVSYRLVAEQYERVLDRLALPSGSPVVDAGAGIGFFSRILAARGFDVTAVDISQVALEAIEGVAAKVCSSLATAPIAPRSAALVHSFDVVYHIMDDAEWEASLLALAGWSSRYVVMHERFLRLPQLVPSRIMKMRTRRQTRSVLERAGFSEIYSAPTSIFGKRLLTYMIANYAPDTFYALDHAAVPRVTDTMLRGLGSHHIKVFART